MKINTLIGITLLIAIIIISHLTARKDIISDYDKINNVFEYSKDYGDGGNDDIAFAIGSIIFFPTLVIYILGYLKKTFSKKICLIFLLCSTLLQYFILKIWLYYGNIFLNLLYGQWEIKLWIYNFILINIYLYINIIIIVVKKMKCGRGGINNK
ncbi:hypothetical protein AGMMS50255_1310 [Spirochaetia bacterium]|nr:hypothetical protein AGMMS50255_1310 [Spirochaetia bacterium]